MKLIYSFGLLLLSSTSNAQSLRDSLYRQLSLTKKDTSAVQAMVRLADYYSFIRFDSTFYFASQAIDMSEKSNYAYGKYLALGSLFFANNTLGNYTRALDLAYQRLKIAEDLENRRLRSMSICHQNIGLVNRENENYPEAFYHLRLAIEYMKESGEPMGLISGPFSQQAIIYMKKHKLDSALDFAEEGANLSAQINGGRRGGLALAILGNVYDSLGNYPLAEKCYREGIQESLRINNLYILTRLYNNLAGHFAITGQTDSCIKYARSSLELCQKNKFGNYALDASTIMLRLYELKQNSDSAYKYLKLTKATSDTIFSQIRSSQFLTLNFDEKQRQQELLTAKEKWRNQVRFYSLMAGLGIFVLIAFILYRNNRQKQRANAALSRQKEELQHTLTDLRITQAQLIQSEKMASLGEMTAGIAHEIQNPLNFVNNFSELNSELLEEMNNAWEEGNAKEARALSEGIKQNLEKINHHGKRADAIVKGMLQHSRTSHGQKESVDLNAMVEEYLRLSYHGMRAKDPRDSANKFFNAKFSTLLDESLGKINIVPQDIGRVLMNLFNNAFYSVSEKRKRLDSQFEPELKVSTKSIGNKVEIRIKDNGVGIPRKNIDKIYQPFFTTKPTGQGTGLGLSLSYDIITKEHGGTMQVESMENEFAEFVIILPMQ